VVSHMRDSSDYTVQEVSVPYFANLYFCLILLSRVDLRNVSIKFDPQNEYVAVCLRFAHM